MKISICIPTYNRAQYLRNCLHSIVLNHADTDIDYEVCVSDNCSSDDTTIVVEEFRELLPVKYQRNSENLGIPRNFLSVVSMADGDFVWLLGDDDLLMPDALSSLSDLIYINPDVDYFYVNSYHLTTETVMSYPQPFSTANLPHNMPRFSSWQHSGKYQFLELIDPEKSFDFLGGMFLSVFRRELWSSNQKALDKSALADKRTFSHFDNTFPHVKIFSQAFTGTQAYFFARPLSICLSGAREWAPMYPFIRSIRLPEALKEYRKNGLKLIRYLICRNYALKYFIPDMVFMIINRKKSGIQYVSLFRDIITNLMYPNFYLSFFYYLGRKVNSIIRA